MAAQHDAIDPDSLVFAFLDSGARSIAYKRGDPSGWNLLGVVCTPSVVWIELGPCTEFVVPKLRAAVSLAELQAWLAGEA